MSRFCTNCGKEIPDGVAFCTECGTKAPIEEMTPPVSAPQTSEPEPQAAAMVCKSCGTALSDGVAFCTECGTPRDGAPAPAPAPTPAAPPPPPPPPRQTYTPPQQSYVPPQPVYTQPVYAQAPVYAPAPAVDESEKVVGTGIFFGLNFLFAVPVIGWIACILMAFVPKNKNIKHYARAMLIWLLIGAVLSVALFFALRGLVGVIKDYANEFIEEYTGQSGLDASQGASSSQNTGSTSDNADASGGIFDSLGQLGELGNLFSQLGGLTGGDLSGIPTE